MLLVGFHVGTRRVLNKQVDERVDRRRAQGCHLSPGEAGSAEELPLSLWLSGYCPRRFHFCFLPLPSRGQPQATDGFPQTVSWAQLLCGACGGAAVSAASFPPPTSLCPRFISSFSEQLRHVPCQVWGRGQDTKWTHRSCSLEQAYLAAVPHTLAAPGLVFQSGLPLAFAQARPSAGKPCCCPCLLSFCSQVRLPARSPAWASRLQQERTFSAHLPPCPRVTAPMSGALGAAGGMDQDTGQGACSPRELMTPCSAGCRQRAATVVSHRGGSN